MPRGKTYTVNGQTFAYQTHLDAAVKSALNSHKLNEEFVDDFLAAVINEHHEEVIRAGQHASGRFLYLDIIGQVERMMDTVERYRGGNVLLGYFVPLEDWRDVTVYPWRKSRNPRVELKRTLREKIGPHLPHPTYRDRCSAVGCVARDRELEYEHVRPTFNEIAEECLAWMTDEEIDSRFGYSKFNPGNREPVHYLPDEHPAVQHLIARHVGNEWTWLCSYHHRGVRKEQQPRLNLFGDDAE